MPVNFAEEADTQSVCPNPHCEDGRHDGMGDGREPDGTAEWWSGVSTTDEHVAHMVAALRSACPTPGVDRILLKDAAAMLFVLHRELRQWREAHERSPAEGEVSVPEGQ